MKTIVIMHHTGEWGGGTKSLLDLCEMLRESYKVIVCIPHGFPEFCKKIEQYGCEPYELKNQIPYLNMYSGSPPFVSVITFRSIKSLKYIKMIGDEILTLKPDVVIFNSIITAVTARYLSEHTRTICIDRETLTNKLEIAFYRKMLDGYLKAITFLADYERTKLGFRKTINTVFPDCIRLDDLIEIEKNTAREKENIPLDKYVVLFMGGLAKIKGSDVMLEAADTLDDRFVVVFAGTIDEGKLSKKQLLHDIKYPSIYVFKKRAVKYYYKLKGSKRLHEAGLRNSVDELIIASDVVVFPSTSVHQPRPCIEAGAYGKPVIITDYRETMEYFKNGYNALTFKPRDAADLKKKIIYAYGHRAEMEDLGKNNRIMTETKHNYYICKDIICSLIEKVCNNAN